MYASQANDTAIEEFLGLLTDKILQDTKEALSSNFSKPELKLALDDMASNKSLGPDGFIIEFFQKYWALIGGDFTRMIQDSIAKGDEQRG